MKRGELYWTELPDQDGKEQWSRRPAGICFATKLTKVSPTVVVIPLMTNLARRSLPTTLLIPKGEGGLAADSVALVDQIRAVDKKRIGKLIGILSDEYLKRLDFVVKKTLGIP